MQVIVDCKDVVLQNVNRIALFKSNDGFFDIKLVGEIRVDVDSYEVSLSRKEMVQLKKCIEFMLYECE